MSGSMDQSRQQLLEDIDEAPVISVNASNLTFDQLREMMAKRNLSVEGSRESMENNLMRSLGCNEVDTAIESLNSIEWNELSSDDLSRLNGGNDFVTKEVQNVKGTSEKITETRKTIKEAQQELAQNCGFGNEIIWDLLTPNDEKIMKNKIKQLIPDQPKGQKEIENLRKTIFKNVWEQKSSDTSNCCMIYIDETGRVYKNWKSFIKENVLPPGTMVAPRKGVYNFDKNNQVILDIYCTPSGTPEAKTMNVAQTGSAVMGIGAACVPIAALAMPVAAPIIAAASVIGLGVGLFTSYTSALNLSDRKKHAQSISITNSQARANYLGIIGGAVGVGAAGATRVMTSMAAAGKATAGIEVLVNGINISSIVLSGSGVANGVLDLIFKYNDGDKISSLDVLQLSASLVLFTNSIYNFQLASQIANDARVNSIKSYRDTLSNRQRKMFDKMSKETVRIRGNTQGKIDIIRGVNEIPDRQYLNDLFKINKQLNQRNVRPAFGESGKNIVLNNELQVDTAALRQNVQHQKGPNILDQITRPIPSTHNSETYTTNTSKTARLLYSNGIVQQNLGANNDPLKDKANNQDPISVWNNLAIALPNGVFIFLKQYGMNFIKNISDGHKFQDVVLSMAENLSERTLQFLMKLAQEFIDNLLEEIHQKLKLFIPTESVLYRIVKHVLDNYRELSFEFISCRGPQIIKAIKIYYLTLNPNNPYGFSGRCPDCRGEIYITEL